MLHKWDQASKVCFNRKMEAKKRQKRRWQVSAIVGAMVAMVAMASGNAISAIAGAVIKGNLYIFLTIEECGSTFYLGLITPFPLI